jgi:dihydroceramide fatty acyl 2-hydroxylase
MWRATPESPKLFESDVLDAGTRVPWFAVPAVHVPLVLALVGWSWSSGVSAGLLALQVALGWVAWTLLEYWLHRTVFHWVPAASWGPRFHFIVHGVHHDWFRDHLRLVMPPWVSLGLAAVVWTLLWLASVALEPALDPRWTYGFFAGIVFGYLVYDLTHYYLHHGKPRTRVGLALRAHHNKHHHNKQYQDKKFGVSTTLWDHVFGTY